MPGIALDFKAPSGSKADTDAQRICIPAGIGSSAQNVFRSYPGKKFGVSSRKPLLSQQQDTFKGLKSGWSTEGRADVGWEAARS